jgi:FtsH-binding integral membrane protein
MSFGKNYDNRKMNPYAALAQNYVPAAQAGIVDRIGFIRKTYMHLGGAVLGFVAIEALIFSLFGDQLVGFVVNNLSGMMWLVVLGAFMGASFLANRWAQSEASISMQYAGLGLYVLAQALIFVPILAIADKYFPGAILSAGLITAVVFVGLTITVFLTQVDFSFMRMALVVGSLAALGAIIAGTVLQLDMFGAVFSSLMVALAAGYILYDTSNILHHYRTDQHVAASLALFAGVAMLFWYILRLVMILQRD